MTSEVPASHFEPEVRLTPGWVAAGLLAGAVAALLASDGIGNDTLRMQVTLLGVLVSLFAAAGWIVAAWRQQIGKGVTLALLVGAVLALRYWLGVPGTLSLVGISTGLSAAMLGLSAATLVTLAESGLILALSATLPGTAARSEVIVALVVDWSLLGVMAAVYHPVYQFKGWATDYLQRAQRALDESLDRKVELAQALEDLGHANRQLVLSTERQATLRAVAEEAQQSKASFVARVSHEFRAPLNMIIGLVGIMIEDTGIYAEELPPDLWQDLRIVYRNCQHLSSMIDDVLDLTQAEAGRLVLHREQTPLASIIESAVDVVQPMIEKKQLDLQVSIAGGLPEIYCDPTRIRQVILNLVSNAARFTIQGGIAIEAARQGQEILVAVADTGPGIPPEEVERVFEPFYSATNARLGDGKGSGLGLSISRQFVRRHGGRMWIESEVGVGTTFYLTLPVAAPAAPAGSPSRWIMEDWVWREEAFKGGRASGRPDMTKPRILVYDETGELYPELSRYTDEVEVVSVAAPAHIERELETCPANALLINAETPESLLSYVEALRGWQDRLPLIGCAIPRSISRAEQLGALCQLVKPVTRHDLEQALHQVGRPVKRILLVDDEPEVLQLWTRMLHIHDRQLEVVTVGDGRQALEVMGRIVPDLVVLDVVMGGMDGWQVLERMAESEVARDIPVIVVSGQDPHTALPTTPYLIAASGDGLPVGKLLRCSLSFSSVLLGPDRARAPAPR